MPNRHLFLLPAVILTVAACGSSSPRSSASTTATATSPASATNAPAAPTTPVTAATSIAAPAANVLPTADNATSPCAVLTDRELSAIMGTTVTAVPGDNFGDAICQYTAAGQPSESYWLRMGRDDAAGIDSVMHDWAQAGEPSATATNAEFRLCDHDGTCPAGSVMFRYGTTFWSFSYRHVGPRMPASALGAFATAIAG